MESLIVMCSVFVWLYSFSEIVVCIHFCPTRVFFVVEMNEKQLAQTQRNPIYLEARFDYIIPGISDMRVSPDAKPV